LAQQQGSTLDTNALSRSGSRVMRVLQMANLLEQNFYKGMLSKNLKMNAETKKNGEAIIHIRNGNRDLVPITWKRQSGVDMCEKMIAIEGKVSRVKFYKNMHLYKQENNFYSVNWCISNIHLYIPLIYIII
jgi:hypothetical protein